MENFFNPASIFLEIIFRFSYKLIYKLRNEHIMKLINKHHLFLNIFLSNISFLKFSNHFVHNVEITKGIKHG